MGVYHELAARYFIRPLTCKMIIYARLRLTKIIFFRGLIKYLAHNHPPYNYHFSCFFFRLTVPKRL